MLKKMIVLVLIFACLLHPSPAFARGGGGDGRGLAIASLAISGAALLYSAGVFYRNTPAGYVVAAPPMGAVVPAIPPGATVVYTNGMPYYYYGNTYYVAGPSGYVVAGVAPSALSAVAPSAPPPVAATAPPPAAVPVTQPVSSASDVFEVYIPNGNGSFTHVSLKKTEKGFLGPQGEFYTDHPTEKELQDRYALKS